MFLYYSRAGIVLSLFLWHPTLPVPGRLWGDSNSILVPHDVSGPFVSRAMNAGFPSFWSGTSVSVNCVSDALVFPLDSMGIGCFGGKRAACAPIGGLWRRSPHFFPGGVQLIRRGFRVTDDELPS